MKELIKVKNTIRDFLRKYEEIIFPILRFGWCYLVFHSIHNMFSYVELLDRQVVLLLLAVLCAMLPDGFLMFITGVVMGFNCFTVDLEVGLAYLLLFLLSYCLYLRFFPKYSYAMFMIPICYMIDMPFLAPLVVVVLVGVGGGIPASLGVVLYYFAGCTRDLSIMLKGAADPDSVEVLKYYIEHILQNKEMLLAMIVFFLTVTVASLLHKLSYPFSWYVAILVGGITMVVSYHFVGQALKLQVNVSDIMGGVLFGTLLALVLQVVKGVLDYPHTQRVQFEDDDYYYYVKAVPKLDAPEKKAKQQAARQAAEKNKETGTPSPERRRELTPEERAKRQASRAAVVAAAAERSENKEERPRRPVREDGEERPRRPVREDGEERPRRPVREDGEERPRRPVREDGEERPRRPVREETEEERERRMAEAEERRSRMQKSSEALIDEDEG